VNVPVEALPSDVVTTIGPVCAPDGTVTVIFVDVNEPAAEALPAKTTDNGGLKFVPLITTVVPTGPLDGL
jgi:hypothetical protein